MDILSTKQEDSQLFLRKVLKQYINNLLLLKRAYMIDDILEKLGKIHRKNSRKSIFLHKLLATTENNDPNINDFNNLDFKELVTKAKDLEIEGQKRTLQIDQPEVLSDFLN